MKKITLNFYDEEVSINMPPDLSTLRKEISEKFLFDPSDVLEMTLSYKKGSKMIFINSDHDFKTFSKLKVTKINLGIKQESKIYQKNMIQIQQEQKLKSAKLQLNDENDESKNPLILWYDFDAGDSFTDALPIGNGYMGGIVYGGVVKDVIGLNEGTVWNGGPGDNNKQGAANHLNEARNALFSGNYDGAESIVSNNMIGYGPASFQPVGNLELGFQHYGAINYYRELDLKTAIAKTKYIHDGVEYIREYFASYPDHVIIIRISANQDGKVSFDATMTTPHSKNSMSQDGNTLIYDVTVNSIKFQNRLAVKNDGGQVSLANNHINVNGANSAYLILTIGTNFNSYDDVSGNPGERASEVMTKVLAKTYQQILDEHLKDYQNLFNRVSLNLGQAHSTSGDKTINRIKGFNLTDDPYLVELYYQFGRYLMISSSRIGGQPANLQGIWNKDTNPAWGSKYTTNINTEMNYWMTESANLPECVIPLIDKVKAMVPQGELTAKVHWGVNEGWVEHHNTDLWNRTAPIDGAWGHWPTGSGWLSTHLWQHYLFNPKDKDFLLDVYPTMKGAAQFYLNSLVEEPVSGFKYLVTAPSASPENSHSGKNVCFAPTMDNQIIRDVFNFTIEASEILGMDIELRNKMKSTVERLAPHKIGQHGQLQEWFDDWDDPKSNHRHVSHLYGMFPSSQITVDETPQLAEGAKNTLIQRGDLSTGWSLAWKINLWARLHDGDHAYSLIKMLLTPDRTYNNMFDAHPPFQIDGNFGAVSGIDEMLIQSHNNKIQILPALPSVWGTGNVSGIRARGGFVIESMKWAGGKLQSIIISSQCGGTLNLKYGDNAVTVETKEGEKYEFDGNLNQNNEVILKLGNNENDLALFDALNKKKIVVLKNSQKKLEELKELKKEEEEINKQINTLEKKRGISSKSNKIKLKSRIKKVVKTKIKKVEKHGDKLNKIINNAFTKFEKFMNKTFNKKEDEKIEDEKEKKIIHNNVTCDGCGVSPIVGVRYKCTICDNFDFCEKCEEKLKFEHQHPFLKIYRPEMCPVYIKCEIKK